MHFFLIDATITYYNYVDAESAGKIFNDREVSDRSPVIPERIGDEWENQQNVFGYGHFGYADDYVKKPDIFSYRNAENEPSLFFMSE